MSYNKQTFVNGNPLTAAQLNHIEEGIKGLDNDISSLNQAIRTNTEDMEKYATKDYVLAEINNAELGGGDGSDIDLSIYALKSEIPTVAKDIGAADEEHAHNASDIKEGVLSIERGGTGNEEGYVRAGVMSGTSAGAYATAEGYQNIASGIYSHAEGNGTSAIGQSSHSEGQDTHASGNYSHAEGGKTLASGDYAHAEGVHLLNENNETIQITTASGIGAHAEGAGTIASGDASHAEGIHTIAASMCQHVQGCHNIPDPGGQYLHIVGNGSGSEYDDERSNAHTLDWSGNAWFAGAIDVVDKATTRQNLGVAPAYTYGETDLTPGVSELATGTLYIVYE